MKYVLSRPRYLISVGVNGTNCFLPVNSVPSNFGELTIGEPKYDTFKLF